MSDIDFDTKKKMMNRFYMSFGTSDNIDDFSGPYTMDLAVATLTNDKFNNRLIEVTFIPDEDSFKSWSSKFEAKLGYKKDFKPTSQFMTNKTFQVCQSKNRIDTNDPLKEGNELYDFDYRIRDIVKGYIGAFTLKKGQAVVVSPPRS